MEIFEYLQKYDYEQLVICQDQTSGLKAIICIHDTTLGPALGGTRMWNYASEEEAIFDALRLARGMTYKNAAAGLNLGGGKTVIIGDSHTQKSEELFRAFGRYVQSLNGRYITAEDVGTTVQDMDWVHLETDFVTGVSSSYGASGDPSPMTARGVWRGMKAAAMEAYGSDSLTGKTIAIQGLGHVGYYLAKHLHEEGAKLIVTDIQDDLIKRVINEMGATAVRPAEIFGVKADIFAPCAMGAVVNDETIPQFKFSIIAGAANNVLKEEHHGDKLHELGILYAPDYVINCGGVINVADELEGYNYERALKKVEMVYDNVAKVLEIAKEYKIPTYIAADRMAEQRIERIGRIRSNYLQTSQ
ncbi:Glu/Leu/Phe/Val dehydrogenase [Desulfosporosinus sp. BICA1-9]|uniref:Glu/Leu/Phe/Val family dehydrogenase n=1 Tax=Desulfosporosinus sp. BICA1-9 TaxID=1531958 RepID=UPI00054C1BB9|nr:Glu/Leu/Phe/Val dehydrogenase [Desulfosporosinus sp. BICA1-9]KJS49831.1 MAG: leucine dehydrogenase [Peptococcaceae bacterium BRH_c23]KJS81974.1 MAG: leucine dehydrogenase [Desulfosporosinus sp. BICA1-9]HBW35762.1 Glu/Leu/Phe/Val dehydrogenase [Desulfosporosinus sp.]